MNYEEKYKEALDAARYWHSNSEGDIPAVLEEIFPELRESEDEKIRKELLQIVKNSEDSFYMVMTPQKRKAIIAWLEKQDTSYTKMDVDDAFVEGMAFAKNELEKQKPDWSEEDETNSYHLKTLLENLAKDNKYEFRIISDNDRDKYTAWLKSLKQRIGWKPSEEQMKALDSVIDEYDGYPEFDSLVSLKNDLKKL